MRKIINLAWLNLVQLFKDRSGLVTLLLVPLMLTVLFGSMLGGGERRVVVAIADEDDTAYSKEIVGALPTSGYDLRHVSEEQARQMASSGEVAASVVIPAGLGDDVIAGVDTEVTVIKDPRSGSAQAVVEAITGRVERVAANAQIIRDLKAAFIDAQRVSGLAQNPPSPKDVYAYADRQWTGESASSSAANASGEPPVSVAEIVVTASRTRGETTQPMGFQQYSLGFTLMFMMFAGMSAAGGFLDEREQGTLARLLTTPTNRTLLVAGKVAGVYVTVIFQASVMIGFGVLVFGVPWGDDPLGVVMLIGTFALAATGMGVMASALVRTRGQMSAVTAVAATSLAMLGGCYWPIDIVSPAMRTVAMFTPTGWAMSGLTDVVVRYQGTSQAIVPSLVLLGMSAAFLGIGVARLKLE